MTRVHLIYQSGKVLLDSLINPASIDKSPSKKIKFAENPSTKVVPQNNCYDPRAPNDNHFGNDSMNIWKKDLQKCLPSLNLPAQS